MMRLDLIVYSVLLVCGLAAAYWASLPTVEGGDDRVTLVAIEPKAIVSITYSGKDQSAVATQREDGRFWVEQKRLDALPSKSEEAEDPALKKEPDVKGDPGAKEQPDPKEQSEAKVVTERFLANEKLSELATALNPLQAERVIGKLEAAQLEEFGLKDKADVVTIKTNDGKVFTYYLGKKSYGSRNIFAMEEGGRVFLIDGQGFENLQRADQRLFERRLLSLELGDVTHATVAAEGVARRLAHTQRDKDGQLTWSDDEENADPKASYASWMDRISKLRLSGYAEQDQESQLAAMAPVLTVSYEKNGTVLDTLIFKKSSESPASYWLYSHFMKVHAKVVSSRVEPILKDLATIMEDAGRK